MASTLLHGMNVIKRLRKRREMDRQPHGHKHVEDLMRVAPDVECAWSPCFW